MPKFIEEILENDARFDAHLDHLLWMDVAFEEPEFPEEPEVHIADAFVPENIETM